MQEQWEVRWMDYYEVFQLQPAAELEVILAVYKMLAAKYHPDNKETGDAAKFKALNEAQAVLADPARRTSYDNAYRQRQRAHESRNQAAQDEQKRYEAAAQNAREEQRQREEPVRQRQQGEETLQKVQMTVSRFIGKTKTLAIVHWRKRELRKAEEERNRRVTEMYRQQYEGNIFHTDLHDVCENLERFVAIYFHDWRLLDRVVSANGTCVDMSYVYRYTEQFRLGELGCRLEPVSVWARMRVGMMCHNGETETVTVPYEVFFRITAKQWTPEGVWVQTDVSEAIDRHNAVPYLRNGHFRAPSMLSNRFPADPGQQLKDFLHHHCHENRPSIQEWFDQESTQMLQEVADLNRKVQHAQQALLEAQTAHEGR
jgi:curved DNA-binding protein CbpA